MQDTSYSHFPPSRYSSIQLFGVDVFLAFHYNLTTCLIAIRHLLEEVKPEVKLTTSHTTVVTKDVLDSIWIFQAVMSTTTIFH